MCYTYKNSFSRLTEEMYMNIIIAGDGNVGSSIAKQLSAEGHDITLVDSDGSVLETSLEKIDVISVKGNCASMAVLRQAKVESADLLIAATGADEVNLLCCTTAHGMNPNIHTIARIRNPEYTDQIYEMHDIFGLSLAVNPERQTAVEIERLLKYPGFLQRDTFAKGRAEIVELRVDKGSALCNLPLKQLNATVKCNVLVCAVIRGGETVTPNGDFVLSEGDRVFFTAPTNNLAKLLKNLKVITRRVKRVMLVGGGRVSYYLAQLLLKDGMSVRIIEDDKERCRLLAESLPEAEVFCGNGADRSVLEYEGLSECDALVTLTGVDELNMIVSLRATAKGVPTVITKLNNVENRTIIDSLSLRSVVCPKELCCESIVRYVRAMQNQSGAAISVHAIADGQAEAVEFLVEKDTPNCGIPLKNIRTRDDVLISSITSGSKTIIPNGESTFASGDIVVIVTGGRGSIRQLKDIFD